MLKDEFRDCFMRIITTSNHSLELGMDKGSWGALRRSPILKQRLCEPRITTSGGTIGMLVDTTSRNPTTFKLLDS